MEPRFLVWLRANATWRRCGSRCATPWAPLAGRPGGAGRSRCVLIPRLGTEFLPEMNEGDIHVTITMPSAVSLERGAEVLRETRLTLLKFPEVKDVLTEQGHPEDGTDDEAPNQAETFVIMKPPEQVAHGAHQGADRRRHARRARAPPGRRLQLQPAHQRPRRGVDLRHPRADRREDLRRRPEPDARASWTRSNAILDARAASRDVEIYRAGSAQHIVADIDREATSRFGVPVQRRRRRRWRAPTAGSSRPAVGGRAPGRRAREAARAAKGTPRASGGWRCRSRPTRACRWRRSPSVHVDRGRTQINREQGGRFLAIKCNIEGRDMGSASSTRPRRTSRREVKLPEGYYLTWGGEFENQRRAMARLVVIVPDLDRARSSCCST